MQALQNELRQRFPAWFQGPRARISTPLVARFAQWSRADRISAFVADHQHLHGFAFVDAALDFLNVRYLIDQVEVERIPERGRVVIVANHPLGAADALALLAAIGRVRRDVRILANDVLARLDGLQPLLLPVRVFGGRPDADSLARIDAALAQEQAVVLFPAGAVARWAWGRVQEGRWRTGFWRYAQRHQAPVLPIHIGGRHSPWFYGLSLLHPGLGTAMLAREMFPARQQRLEIRIGQAWPAPAAEQRDAAAAAQRLRHWVAALGRGEEAPTAAPHSLRHAPCLRRLREDVEALPLIGRTEDGKEIRAGLLDADSALLLEVARQRERAFRAVGEGTGLACDRDRYDAHYEHIVVWDREALAVAGAYRVAHAGRVLASRGVSGLYTASLFEFDPALVARLSQAVELGRSFVAPEYWGTRSLEYLWYGIGAWLRQHPEVRYLFGPVSISAALPQAAREQLVAFYQTHYGSRESWARSRHPFVSTAAVPDFAALEVDAAQALLRENLRALGARIPTLYKQYTELSEPGGVRFLAFGVDPDFAGATDGLLWLDLSRLKPRKRERYLGHTACGGVTA